MGRKIVVAVLPERNDVVDNSLRQSISPASAIVIEPFSKLAPSSVWILRRGDLIKGDLLIEGATISTVGPDIDPAGAQVIDELDTIIMPGIVDCHRHSWEEKLRRLVR